jgi:DNA-binding response OmpR family regulator
MDFGGKGRDDLEQFFVQLSPFDQPSLAKSSQSRGSLRLDVEMGHRRWPEGRFVPPAPDGFPRKEGTRENERGPMTNRSVLVVDGDPEGASTTAKSIATSGLEILEAASGRDAIRLVRTHDVDLVLTEAVLPDVTGLGLMRMLREADIGPVRVLMISRLSSEVDRLIAFEAGVDDFVPRPYAASELAARVRAILRRADAESRGNGRSPAETGFASRSMRSPDYAGSRVSAALRWERPPTPKEVRVVEELAGRGGRVVSRRDLLQTVWGTGIDRSERVVDAHIKAIRAKLGRDRDCIETVRGVGYRFREPAHRGA